MSTSTDTATPPDRDPAEAARDLRFRFPGYLTEVGPVTHLQAERERLARLTWQHFEATPMGATIGAELAGVDLRAELANEVVAEIRQALLDYKVIFFRDQAFTPAQHVAFALSLIHISEPTRPY